MFIVPILLAVTSARVQHTIGERAESILADSVQAENDKHLQALKTLIAGKEELPASEVFKNISIMKNSTAGRLLNVMNFGFSRSLGVSCAHCHTPGKWESDDKPAKRTARAMSGMVSTINRSYLRSIGDIKSENPIVNCTTCHRGKREPGLEGFVAADSAVQKEKVELVAEAKRLIEGRESEPAGTVFKNVMIFKEMNAQRLITIMERGYSRALGVSCTHCHVRGKWESDEKPAKRIARSMAGMASTIIEKELKTIESLDEKSPVVNCSTCHRGQMKPALELRAN